MYYIWSFVISIILFIIIYLIEKKKNDNDNIYTPLISINNITSFIVLYLLSTIVIYFASNTDDNDVKDNNITYIKDNKYIDPSILKKINEDIDVGFSPYNDELYE